MATPDVHTDFKTVVNERRSIRGYKPIPVPRELIEEVIEIAKRAPSSMNTQPETSGGGGSLLFTSR